MAFRAQAGGIRAARIQAGRVAFEDITRLVIASARARAIIEIPYPGIASRSGVTGGGSPCPQPLAGVAVMAGTAIVDRMIVRILQVGRLRDGGEVYRDG